ncbi:MAG: hypothetical protein HYS12_23435 [Planctomycetes bacterium]|nr:hypothetical protein [Planctomycetota bacterium]
MSKRFWAIVVIVAVGLTIAVRMAANAQAPKPPAVEAPFKGKVVVFALKKDSEKSTALQEPSIKRLGEVDFLTGQVAGSTAATDWRLGAVVWVPVADIGEMVEFKDLREAKRVLRLNP